MPLNVKTNLAPMESKAVRQIPRGENWLYEPKWDGFRCVAFRDGSKVSLQSKAGQPLARYFPEIVGALLSLKPRQFALDGEIVIPEGNGLSFDKLLQRLHPAESRITKLSVQTPALLIVFDLLAAEDGRSLLSTELGKRRKLLEQFAKKFFAEADLLRLSPATKDVKKAEKWFGAAGAALDGIIAKRLDEPYHSGDREGMVKVKPVRTAECVVGGFRYGTGQKVIGSLLLGLYDDTGLLHHVGFCSALKAPMKKELTPKLEKLIKPPGFTGSAPGGPSRWATDRSGEWQPLDPKLVVEVEWGHFTNGRFRHGTKFVRFRPDKPPRKCTLDQVELESAGATELLG